MKHDLPEAYNLGEMDQIAIVVNDLDSALPAYKALFGDFHLVSLPAVPVVYRGKDIAIPLKMAFGKAEFLEIEIIEPTGGENGETGPFGEHLKKHGDGLHHFRFKVDNLQETLQAMEADGYKKIYGNLASEHPWVYVEEPDKIGHTFIELVEGLSSSTK